MKIDRESLCLDKNTIRTIEILAKMIDKAKFNNLGRTEIWERLPALHAFMFADSRNPPHPLIQSYYIMLWANANIYHAMNYILSAFCKGLDEVAVVTVLKQLSSYSGGDGAFVNVIKAIWDGIFCNSDLKYAVLQYATQNVASYSLMTLAVHHPSFDTFERLLFEAMDADQQITLVVYNCIARRLIEIPSEMVNDRHRSLVESIWRNSIPLMQKSNITQEQKVEWMALMMGICDVYRLECLEECIKTYHDDDHVSFLMSNRC